MVYTHSDQSEIDVFLFDMAGKSSHATSFQLMRASLGHRGHVDSIRALVGERLLVDCDLSAPARRFPTAVSSCSILACRSASRWIESVPCSTSICSISMFLCSRACVCASKRLTSPPIFAMEELISEEHLSAIMLKKVSLASLEGYVWGQACEEESVHPGSWARSIGAATSEGLGPGMITAWRVKSHNAEFSCSLTFTKSVWWSLAILVDKRLA